MAPKHERRILTLSTVTPCEAIAPATLLNALTALARTIVDFAAKPLGHRRIAREAIREIGILLFFFEEIRELPGSAVLCFSELYLVLLKIQFLLEDCSREGTRLWMVIKSERVVNGFRILNRSLATVLDVLPLSGIDVSAEIKELVDMIRKQVQRVNIEINPIDEQIAKDVHEVLRGFENKIVPDPDNLRQILDHLEILNWTDCTKEIKFLEEQINFENSEADREIALLSSLIGFLNYCRCVLFELCDSGLERSDRRNDAEIFSYLNPDDFRCPISLQLMKDPVTVATGQTYDRESILRWFKAGNLICPKTGEKLQRTDLVPNSALLNLIRQFCYENGVQLVEPSDRSRNPAMAIFPASEAAAEATRMVSVFLVNKLSTGTEKEKNKAACEIRMLAKSCIFYRACLVEAEAIPWLLHLLSSSDPSMQENAMAALLNLSKHSMGKPVIIENGGLYPILDVLRDGLKMEARQISAATLFYLSSVDEYRRTIGEVPEAIPALVGLLRNGTFRGKKNAVAAILGLLLYPGNHRRVLAAGAIPHLINLLSTDREDLVNDSLAVLVTLAEKPEGSNAILSASTIPLLAGILHSGTSPAGKEYCVTILLSLCINGGAEVVTVLQKSASIMSSLYSLLTSGIPRASKKAGSLLNFLHNFQDSSSSEIFIPAVRRKHSPCSENIL